MRHLVIFIAQLAWVDPRFEPQDEWPVDVVQATPGELRELASVARAALTEKVLAVSSKWIEQNAELLELPDTGIVRLVARGSALQDKLAVDGGGSYVDLVSGAHQYQGAHDLTYEGECLFAMGWGGDMSWILGLGETPLASVPLEPEPVPAALGFDQVLAWQASWAAFTDEEIQDSLRPEGCRRSLLVEPGETALMRMRSRRYHDILAGLHVLERDEESCTVLYRILRRWPIQEPSPVYPPSSPPAVEKVDVRMRAWIESLDQEALEAFIEEVSRIGLEKLLAIPEEPRALYEELMGDRPLASGQSDFARLAFRGEWEAIDKGIGGANYYSFLERRSGWSPDLRADLDLQRSSGFTIPGEGRLLDLGALPFEELASAMTGTLPADLPEHRQEALSFLSELRFDRDEFDEPCLSPEAMQYVESLPLAQSVPALPGHTYVLRTATPDRDTLVIFTVLQSDEGGQTIAWSLLESFPVD